MDFMITLINFFNKFYTILTSFLAISGGIIALFQWDNSIKIKRAEYVNSLYDKIRSNEKINNAIYKFDYDEEIWYDDNFHGSSFERDVDDALNYFSFICYLRQSHLISNKEFDFFKYQIDKSLKSKQVEQYLYNVYFHCKLNNLRLYFNYLFEYIKRNKFYENDFFTDPLNPNYTVRLKWRDEYIKSKQ